MMLNLIISIPSTWPNDNIIKSQVSFTDPKNGNCQQSAEIIINCTDILGYCSHAPKAAFDLFFLAACVYGIDKLIPRKPYSIDGWSRELKLSIPLLDSRWAGNEAYLAETLSFLTGDYWSIAFLQSNLQRPDTQNNPVPTPNIIQINLFSGGMDSLIGAIDYLKVQDASKLLLISHYDPDIRGPKSDQQDLFEELRTKYSTGIAWTDSVGVYLRSSTLGGAETTLRSRSILFIGLAVLAACAIGQDKLICVPENGSVSLNYPLSPSRRTACSTRTTHPHFLGNIRGLLQRLSLSSRIVNPYEFSTKGQMVRNCKDRPFLLTVVQKSNSCGKRGHRRAWTRRNASHCGVCMPCTYRRASLNGCNDETTYGSNIDELKWDINHQRLIKKHGQDMEALLQFLGKDLTREQIESELLVNGIENFGALPRYVDVILETRNELKTYVSTNPDTVVRQKAGLP